MSQSRKTIVLSDADMSLPPNMMCEKAVKIYNTLVVKNSKRMYNYNEAFPLFYEAVNRFNLMKKEKERRSTSTIHVDDFRNYGEALYHLYECYLYGRGTRKNEKNADIMLENMIDEKLVNEISDENKKEEHQIRSVISILNNKTYISKNYSLGYSQKAHNIISLIGKNNYTDDIILVINSLYRIAVILSESIEKNKNRTTDIKYDFFQFMLSVLDYYITTNHPTAQDNAWEENALQMLILSKELISAGSTKAMCQYADIISATDPLPNRIYHRIYLAYKKHIIDKPKYSSNLENPLNMYINSTNRGDLCAAEKIAKHYYEIGNYTEMAWWFWWAVVYDNNVKKIARGKTILYKIRDDPLLTKIFDKMSQQYTDEILSMDIKDKRAFNYIRQQYFIQELVKHKKESKRATTNR